MYYFSLLNRLMGPFTQEEIYELIRRGEITQSTPIQFNSETRPAIEWPEFRVLFSLQAPSYVIPPQPMMGYSAPYVPAPPYTQPAFLSLLRFYCFVISPILGIASLFFIFSGFSDSASIESPSLGYGINYNENQGFSVVDLQKRDTAVSFILISGIIEIVWLIVGAVKIPTSPRSGLNTIVLGMFIMTIVDLLCTPLLANLPAPQVSDEVAGLFVLLGLGTIVWYLIVFLYWMFVSHTLPREVQNPQ